ncbi:MAG: ribonuclease III [Gammaproteobacteria bacterium]|nr:ribonuclease III [Gammaproteobacteria bacterium]
MILESGLSLAYIGDAVYELEIRKYLLSLGITKVKELHNEAIKFTSAHAQALIMAHLMDKLSEEEIEYYKRGRNSGGTHKPKNFSLKEYREATGFESLIGAIFLEKNEERLREIIDLSISFAKENFA